MAASMTTIRTCAAGSSLRACGAFDSGTNRWVATIAAIPMGTLIQKMDRQPAQPGSHAAKQRAQREDR
jgi:hypothetical protein